MATMSQEEVDAWLGAHGGGQLQHGIEKKQVRNPNYNEVKGPTPSNPEFITIDVETWTNSKTGAKLVAQHLPDGSWERHDAVEGDPNKQGSQGSNVPTNTTEPYIVTRNPDGSLKQEPNPNYRPPATDVAKPPEQKDEGGRRYVWKPNPGGPNAGGRWEDVGSAPETPAERQAREANAPSQSIRTENGGDGKPYTVITIVPKPGQPGQPGQIVLGPDGKVAPGGVPGKPAQEKKETVTVNGKVYIQVSKQNPDGTVELYHTDQSGNRVALPDMAPDQPSTAGPALPEFVLGHSQEALGTYKRQLQEGVAKGLWSQKWANERWTEALQVADVAVKDAATTQRDIESKRNDQYSRATQSLNFMQNTTKNAFDTVEKLNGLLPEGSSLGGQAFAAMLGLSMMQQALSGINRRPDEPQPPTPPTLADLSNPDALAAKRQQIMANPVFRPAQPVTSAQDAALRTPPPVGGPAEAPSRGAIPPARPPAPVAAPAPAAPAPAALPPNRPDQTQAAPQIENAINPPGTVIPAPGQIPAAIRVRNKATGAVREIANTQFGTGLEYDPSQYDVVPADASDPNVGHPGDPGYVPPSYGKPDGGTPPQPIAPSTPGFAPQTMAPPAQTDYPVLASMAPPSFAFSTPAPQSSADPYPAQLYSQAASKAPWEMSPAEIQHYTDMGIPDEVVWGVPGLKGNAA